MCRFKSPLLLLALLTAPAAAQDAVDIKISFPKPGERARITVEEKTVSKMTINAAGMEQKKDEVKSKSLVYIDDVIENPKNTRRATKLRRTYDKAVIGNGGNLTRLPIEGKTVLIEKKGDAYSFTVDGKELTGDSLKLLADEFKKSDEQDSRRAILPQGPVKPGGKWKPDTKEIIKAFGADGPTFDKDRITASGTLIRTYKKDGKQFGVMDIVVEGPLANLGESNPIKLSEGKLVLSFQGEGCIDGTSATGRSSAKMLLEIAGSVNNVDIKATVNTTEQRTTEVLPKK